MLESKVGALTEAMDGAVRIALLESEVERREELLSLPRSPRSDDSELRRQIDSICRQEFAFLGKVLVDSSATSLR